MSQGCLSASMHMWKIHLPHIQYFDVCMCLCLLTHATVGHAFKTPQTSKSGAEPRSTCPGPLSRSRRWKLRYGLAKHDKSKKHAHEPQSEFVVSLREDGIIDCPASLWSKLLLVLCKNLGCCPGFAGNLNAHHMLSVSS